MATASDPDILSHTYIHTRAYGRAVRSTRQGHHAPGCPGKEQPSKSLLCLRGRKGQVGNSPWRVQANERGREGCRLHRELHQWLLNLEACHYNSKKKVKWTKVPGHLTNLAGADRTALMLLAGVSVTAALILKSFTWEGR